MICAKYDPKTRTLTVEGHSRSAPKGEDLVCSAATILVMALADCVEERCADKALSFRDGYAKIHGDDRAEAEFAFVLRGLKMLASVYPDHVTVAE